MGTQGLISVPSSVWIAEDEPIAYSSGGRLIYAVAYRRNMLGSLGVSFEKKLGFFSSWTFSSAAAAAVRWNRGSNLAGRVAAFFNGQRFTGRHGRAAGLFVALSCVNYRQISPRFGSGVGRHALLKDLFRVVQLAVLGQKARPAHSPPAGSAVRSTAPPVETAPLCRSRAAIRVPGSTIVRPNP